MKYTRWCENDFNVHAYSKAQAAANTLGGWLWGMREKWANPPMGPAEALRLGEEAGKYPIILADQGDNPGGGAPSDATEVLQLFQQRKLQKAAVLYIGDAESAVICHEAGV
jgi:microcystin degradation protein MlrC